MTHGPTIVQVDAAVRAVLAGLGRGAAPSAPEVFAGRLFSLRHAEELAGSSREIRIGPGTVVTPLARDHLKRAGIPLRLVAQAEVEKARRPGEWGFAIESASGLLAALRREILSGPKSWSEIADAEPARWVAGSQERGATWLTAEASVAVWRANRVAGVRAAMVGDAESVARAVKHLGANLLVIEPAGKSIFSLKQLFATYRRAGAPKRPDWMEGAGHEDCRGDRAGDALAGTSGAAERALLDRLAHASGRIGGGVGGAGRGGHRV